MAIYVLNVLCKRCSHRLLTKIGFFCGFKVIDLVDIIKMPAGATRHYLDNIEKKVLPTTHVPTNKVNTNIKTLVQC